MCTREIGIFHTPQDCHYPRVSSYEIANYLRRSGNFNSFSVFDGQAKSHGMILWISGFAGDLVSSSDIFGSQNGSKFFANRNNICSTQPNSFRAEIQARDWRLPIVFNDVGYFEFVIKEFVRSRNPWDKRKKGSLGLDTGYRLLDCCSSNSVGIPGTSLNLQKGRLSCLSAQTCHIGGLNRGIGGLLQFRKLLTHFAQLAADSSKLKIGYEGICHSRQHYHECTDDIGLSMSSATSEPLPPTSFQRILLISFGLLLMGIGCSCGLCIFIFKGSIRGRRGRRNRTSRRYYPFLLRGPTMKHEYHEGLNLTSLSATR